MPNIEKEQNYIYVGPANPEEMVFCDGVQGTPYKKIRSPEELAQSGIQISEDAMEKQWGPGAVERYRWARFFLKIGNEQPTMEGKNA